MDRKHHDPKAALEMRGTIQKKGKKRRHRQARGIDEIRSDERCFGKDIIHALGEIGRTA